MRLNETMDQAAKTYSRLALGAKAVALQDHQRMLRDHATRVRDSHRAMMQAAGFEAKEQADEPMGDIGIGDTYIFGGQAATPAPANNAAAAPQVGSLLKNAAIATVLLAAGGGAGVAVPWALGMFNRGQPPAATSPNEYVLRVVPDDAPEGEPK
mgnify:CR=1 FL=1